MNKRIFNSVEEIKDVYGVDVNISDDLPDGCNVVSYHINGLYSIQFCDYYRLDEFGLSIFADFEWRLTQNSIEDEICEDIDNGYSYIYLRLTQQEKKEKFTPERLLGVETDYGYVTTVITADWFSEYIKSSYYVYTTESLSKEDLRDVHNLKFYISDDSDETVSFDEYVDMFYERE